MSKTRHLQQRMSQRGITSEIIEIVTKFGHSCGDKVILTKKNCEFLSQKLATLKRTIDKMAEKGGYTVVSCEGALITTYRVDRYNRKLTK
jgi:hypothetical protein